MSKLLDTIHEYWNPHKGQKEVLREIIGNDKEMVYVECGRKWGKTEFGVYLCWLFALSHPKAHIYYYGPQDDQSKELVWANNRMQTCNTYDLDFVEKMGKYLGGEIKTKDSEMRVIFPNGSFIRCDGSNNFNAHRGLQPNLVVCDEYRDFKGEWYEAYKPNLLARQGKILFITTPQSWYNHSQKMADYCKSETHPEAFYLNQPSIKNDQIAGHIKWLSREKKRLLEDGKFDVWKREYEAGFISGGESTLIPQLNRGSVLKHLDVIKALDGEDVEYGAALTTNEGHGQYAVLAAYVQRTAKVYILDIYKQEERSKSTVTTFASGLLNMVQKIKIGSDINTEWNVLFSAKDEKLRDSFMDKCEILGTCGNKEVDKVPYLLDEIREMISKNDLVISERAIALVEENELTANRPDEVKSVIRDSKGSIPILTSIKTLLEAFNYSFKKIAQPMDRGEAIEWEDKLSKSMPFEHWVRKVRMDNWGIDYNNDEFIDSIDFWNVGDNI
jgi:hypothetical protein